MFDEKIIHAEDGDWLIKLMILKPRCEFTNEIIYMYNIFNLQSVTKTKYTLKKFMSCFLVYTKWFDYFINKA